MKKISFFPNMPQSLFDNKFLFNVFITIGLVPGVVFALMVNRQLMQFAVNNPHLNHGSIQFMWTLMARLVGILVTGLGMELILTILVNLYSLFWGDPE